MSVVARFEIGYSQFLDPHGVPVRALPDFAREAADLVPLYRDMVLTRTYEARAVALQRTGQLGTVASALGQEAIGVAVGRTMRPEDVFFPTYRESGIQLVRGVTMLELLRYWAGDEAGQDYAGPRQDFPVCITIAAHCCHAAGVATAFKLRHEPRVAVCVIGDGATSKGDFYEALNLAGAWKLPVVFVVINNQWAISVPRGMQTAATTLAQKAIAAGVEGEQVDGNDAVAVYHCMAGALAHARAGAGPRLLECLSYRLADHTTADDARRYADPEEATRRWPLEPVSRLRKYLTAVGAWTRQDEERLIAQCQEQVREAVEQFLSLPAPGAEAMFDCLYASLPAALAEQRDTALVWSRRG